MRHIAIYLHKTLLMACSAVLLVSGPATAQSTLPLLSMSDLEYVGAFRLPKQNYGASSVNYSYGAIGFNSANSSLFIAGHEREHSIAEFRIPALVRETSVGSLNTAPPPLQDFVNLLHKAPISYGQNIIVGGLYPVNGRLLVNIYEFYDNSVPYNKDTTLVARDLNNINTTAVDGYLQMDGAAKAAGWVSPVPQEWQAAVGGTHITGFSSSTNRAMIHSGSAGPSAFSFNAAEVADNSGSISAIPTTELLGYTKENGLVPEADLYNDSGNNTLWTHASEASFGMIVPGTSTYMVLGFSGGHVSGMSYGDPPYGGYKGHYTIDQYDKYAYYWLFDVNDLVRAKNGTITPHEIRPYTVGKFQIPLQISSLLPVSGGTYDPETGTMYLSVRGADYDQANGSAPIIIAYKFQLGAVEEFNRPLAPSNLSLGN